MLVPVVGAFAEMSSDTELIADLIATALAALAARSAEAAEAAEAATKTEIGAFILLTGI